MKVKVNKTGQVLHFEGGCDEFALSDALGDDKTGTKPVYVRECVDGEAFFFSDQPITLKESVLIKICEGDDVAGITQLDD